MIPMSRKTQLTGEAFPFRCRRSAPPDVRCRARLHRGSPPHALGKPCAPALPVFLMQFLVDKGAGVVFLVNAVQPDHIAAGIYPDGFGGLGNAPARGQKSSSSKL